MISGRPLPKFKSPPVSEVSLGMRFQAPKFSPVHFGLFYESVRKRYPTFNQLQFLPPEFLAPYESPHLQSRPPQPFDLSSFVGVGQLLPIRMAYISEDETSLIQLQGDRIYFNWRSDSGDYPHFGRVRDGFLDAYNIFISFAEENGFGPVKPILSEILYINPLPTRSDPADLSAPEEMFRIIQTANIEDWDCPLNDFSFNARYKLMNADGKFAGWLTSSMTSGYLQNEIPKVNLQMIARGVPLEEGLEGVLAFHEVGHEAIVRCFAAITSDKMHSLWGRINE